ncbi:heme utilization cystosolic carrier protein HutX [Pasteurellaceae bacterium HPA106]|uniref:heme utilization cystosolic carrier protein HutX n=1 Tax=Spirabiliibacterium pneumoniae TaxID=221400 RepID=UPI001AAD9170|nr:heme utilization cystosolic carrier protein HutX [Spirabiliibacterium pneumoniae]MBE2895669.1 heme utilization cystosolic carrier protein HutX [Spirabiliibacterium pneumoniae]
MSDLRAEVAQLLAQTPEMNTLDLATKLAVGEGNVILALPEKWVTVLPGEQCETLLEHLTQWGNLVTIIEKEGSIFEVKQPFPHGRSGYGYYNLNMHGGASTGTLYGHLKLSQVDKIALVSKPLRGKESYAFAFITKCGQVMFKIYLGRDEKRALIPEQVTKFKQLLSTKTIN